MKELNMVALVVLIIGGLNWGLVGVADFNLVTTLFGTETMLTNIVYILVGVSALYNAVINFMPNCCDKK